MWLDVALCDMFGMYYDQDGKTALDYAKEGGYTEIAEMVCVILSVFIRSLIHSFASFVDIHTLHLRIRTYIHTCMYICIHLLYAHFYVNVSFELSTTLFS